MFSIIIFYNSTAVFYADIELKKESIIAEIIPTPKTLSSDCGIALKLLKNDTEKSINILKEKKIETQGIYKNLN